LPLIGDGPSLFRTTLDRVTGDEFAAPIIVCNHNHRFLVAEEMNEAGLSAQDIIIEPVARNTAPAIATAALHILADNPEGLIFVLPSDHAISDLAAFRSATKVAARLAMEELLVTFGIEPEHPETGYGYIRRGPAHDKGYRIAEFVEKPDQETAEAYVDSGEYYWNAGIFLFRARTFIDQLRKHSPDVLSAAERAIAQAVTDVDFLRLNEQAFELAPSISVDYAVMEKTSQSAVVPLDGSWSDVGSWESLAKHGVADDDGNVCIGEAVVIDSQNNYIRSEKPLVAVLGIDNIALIATDDTVLAMPKSRAQEVKSIVAELEAQGREEIIAHTRVYRPWGHYQNVESGAGFRVKQIVVKPGAKLSMQYHNHRAEHWVVVEGVARVTNGDAVFELSANQSTYIPLGTKHRLENPTDQPLRLVEVQTGDLISEDDIVRLEDTYGRA
jgi:mannose-1-phosphate guanylyltransferase/mannose-6-phosphate isomerase